MTEPDRRAVRVRRSPKVAVFLVLGVLAGVVAAVLFTLLTPQDGQYPTSQVLGFTVLLLAPIGAVLGGLVAVVLDVMSTRRARVLEAERVRTRSGGSDQS
jgi:uncharacterized metal-binding protein